MAHSALITVITRAIFKAAKPLVRDFGEVEKLQVSKKGTADFVTNADIRTEEMLVSELQHARKDFSFLTEETGVIGGESEYRFVIDPIDGTTNFIHAIPYFCISVGVEKKNTQGGYEPFAGVIYSPIQDELFVAELGQGATRNDHRIQVSKREDDLLLSTATPRKLREDYEVVERALHQVTSLSTATVRCPGASALDLAYLAAGRYDGLWYHMIKPWDMAAGIILVREAGGIVTDMSGHNQMMSTGSLIASNGKIHQSLQRMLLS